MVQIMNKAECKKKMLENCLFRLNEITGENFVWLRNWDCHRYDFGTFEDSNNSIASYKRHIEKYKTTDNVVIINVLEAFNRISDHNQFTLFADKAIELLQHVKNALKEENHKIGE